MDRYSITLEGREHPRAKRTAYMALSRIPGVRIVGGHNEIIVQADPHTLPTMVQNLRGIAVVVPV